MKKFIVGIVTCLLIVAGLAHASVQMRKSDAFIRNRVLMLKSLEGSCSAVEVRAPSGAIYTLSAAHCSVLINDGSILAINEQDVQKRLNVVKIDYDHDLMMLEAFDGKSISIASGMHKHQHVHVIAHGAGYPSYRVDGELLVEQMIKIGENINSDKQLDFCHNVPGSDLVHDMLGMHCEFSMLEMQSSANVQSGASGGPALNNDGELIGIVSSGDGVFSGFVPLHFIKDFVKDK